MGMSLVVVTSFSEFMRGESKGYIVYGLIQEETMQLSVWLDSHLVAITANL